LAQIDVSVTEKDETYQCEVTVTEGNNQTRHSVTLDKADYKQLAQGKVTPKELVAESFRFLLEREPKEAILRSFELTVISRYFPSYEREIKKRLSG